MPAQQRPDQARRFDRRVLIAASAAGAASLLSGCVPSGGRSEDDAAGVVPPWLTVVATTPILGDIIRSVGGSRVEVRAMMPPSADPRRFVPGPTAGDVFVDADVIVRHGLGLEPGLEGLLAAAGDIPVVMATETIPADSIIATAGGNPDPYIWQDPTQMPWLVSRVLQALIDQDDNEVHRAAWDRNSVVYLNQIALADDYLQRRLDRIPAERRILATANATFAYFGRRYGFETLALLDDTVPFPVEADVDRFAAALLANQASAVFPDASMSPTAIQTAILHAATSAAVIPLAGLLYGSGLGLGNTYPGRYLGMVRQNADRIALALS